MTFDYPLFLWLNFDGGAAMDSLMLAVSGKWTWVPLYLLLAWLAWRYLGWRKMLAIVVCAALAVALSDMLAGIFKHNGLLGDVWSSFPARLRPMYTPELEGQIHIVRLGGQFGTVSAHAATATAIAVLFALTIRKWWLSTVLAAWVVLICYSRIYLAYHFPFDIVLGMVTGALSATVMWLLYRLITTAKNRYCKKI